MGPAGTPSPRKDNSIPTIESSHDLTLDLMTRVGNHGEPVRLGEQAIAAITERRQEFLAFVKGNLDQHLYGITTRHHTGAKTVLEAEARDEYSSRLPTIPATVGHPLPERVTRMIVVARLADVLNGTACLRAETAKRMTDMLDGPLPPVPDRGHGEPGDIIALSHLFRAEFDGTLELGEGMAIVNGSPVAAAVLCDIALAGKGRLLAVGHALALAAAAAEAPEAHYSAHLELAWNDPFQAAALAELRRLLEGRDDAQRAYQAPVSFRSAPRLLGWALRCQSSVEEVARMALPASSNNPIFVGADAEPPLGAIVSNGGYHSAVASPAIDAAARSWADLCQLVTAQVNQLVEAPTGLTALEPEPQVTLFYMTSAGWAEEARAAATPTLTSIAAAGQTDTGTLDVLAWRKAQDAGNALDQNLALLAVIAAHTLARQERTVPPALRDFCDGVLERFPVGASPVEYGSRLAAVAELIQAAEVA